MGADFSDLNTAMAAIKRKSEAETYREQPADEVAQLRAELQQALEQRDAMMRLAAHAAVEGPRSRWSALALAFSCLSLGAFLVQLLHTFGARCP